MRTHNPEREERIKAEIVAAAKRVFQAYGMEKTTMDDIAKAAGKGTSSLYYYFKNKDDVFYAVVQSEFDGIYGTINRVLAKCKTAPEKLRALLLTRYDEFKKRAYQYSSLVSEIPKFGIPERLQDISRASEIEILRTILQEGVEKGEFRHLKKKEIDSIVMSIMLFWRSLAADMAISREFPPDTLNIAVVVGALVRGLE